MEVTANTRYTSQSCVLLGYSWIIAVANEWDELLSICFKPEFTDTTVFPSSYIYGTVDKQCHKRVASKNRIKSVELQRYWVNNE